MSPATSTTDVLRFNCLVRIVSISVEADAVTVPIEIFLPGTEAAAVIKFDQYLSTTRRTMYSSLNSSTQDMSIAANSGLNAADSTNPCPRKILPEYNRPKCVPFLEIETSGPFRTTRYSPISPSKEVNANSEVRLQSTVFGIDSLTMTFRSSVFLTVFIGRVGGMSGSGGTSSGSYAGFGIVVFEITVRRSWLPPYCAGCTTGKVGTSESYSGIPVGLM